MSQYTVLFDANVLYPAPMRDADAIGGHGSFQGEVDG